jgi:hypothetical protein
MGIVASRPDEEIVKIALSSGYWIYGGWVRDRMAGLDTFADIDIGCSNSQMNSIHEFISKLEKKWKITVTFDNFRDQDGSPSKTVPHLNRGITLDVEGIKIDLGMYTSFDHWKSSRGDDEYSCNIFYIDNTDPRPQIKYIPDGTSENHMYDMVKNRRFFIIREKDKKRSTKLTENGWVLF